jgi:hypothetical protein
MKSSIQDLIWHYKSMEGVRECTHDLGKGATNPSRCIPCNAVILLVGNGVGKPFRQVIVG